MIGLEGYVKTTFEILLKERARTFMFDKLMLLLPALLPPEKMLDNQISVKAVGNKTVHVYGRDLLREEMYREFKTHLSNKKIYVNYIQNKNAFELYSFAAYVNESLGDPSVNPCVLPDPIDGALKKIFADTFNEGINKITDSWNKTFDDGFTQKKFAGASGKNVYDLTLVAGDKDIKSSENIKKLQEQFDVHKGVSARDYFLITESTRTKESIDAQSNDLGQKNYKTNIALEGVEDHRKLWQRLRREWFERLCQYGACGKCKDVQKEPTHDCGSTDQGIKVLEEQIDTFLLNTIKETS